MKNIILATIVVMIATFTSCKMEQLIAVSYDKHTIQNDTNWVEVIDIDTINVCLSSYWSDKDLNNRNIIIKNEEEYKEIFEDAILTSGKNFLPYCDTVYKPTGIDFDKRFMIMYGITGADDKFTRQIFLNKSTSEYLYLISINRLSLSKVRRCWWEYISLPIVNGNAKVTFDTIHVNFGW